jgi:hypothetical protein
MSEKDVDVGRVEGWVEIIVRDKNGKIKYHIGSPPKPQKPQSTQKCEDEHNCPLPPPIMSTYPAKTVETAYWIKNIITNVGLAAIVRLIGSGLTETKFGYTAIGTGTTAEAATDTALVTEIKRKTATVSQTTTTITNDTCLFEATFSSADTLSGSSNVAETGIFNASTGGILLARKTFSAVPLNWDAGDQITIKYYVQFTR